MNAQIATVDVSNEELVQIESLRDLGDVELCLVGGGDVVVVGL
jgi:hypothetical protein